MNKIPAFDYVVNHIQNWYVEEGGSMDQNDLSRLKLTKLLFFTCAASAKPDDSGLLSVFDNFHALPFGHVESDIQDQMEESVFFNITKTNLTYKAGVANYSPAELDVDTQLSIDNAINKLKIINKDLVKQTAFDLVDLSHLWQSWKSVFSLAKQYGKYSMKIPNQMIMTEPKIFRM